MVFPTWRHHGHWCHCIHTVSPRLAHPRALAPSIHHGRRHCALVRSDSSDWPPRNTKGDDKSQNSKRLTILQSITPPIGPGTRADHGADSAAGHPGRMRNRFRSFRCSWVRGSKVRKWFRGAQMSPPNHLHLDPFLSSLLDLPKMCTRTHHTLELQDTLSHT